jgi:mRNA interferase MazF
MRRGDIVTVAASGDNGKPRPAVIVGSDAFPLSHASVIVCQMTPDRQSIETFRIDIEPSSQNGLTVVSQIMVDKPVIVRRERVGRVIGRLGEPDVVRLNAALAWVMGLGDL